MRTAATATNKTPTNMSFLLAEITGNIASAFGLLGAGIGVGMIGNKAAEAVGRNPGASTKILVQALVFTLLTSVYIGLIVNHGDDHGHEGGHAAEAHH